MLWPWTPLENFPDVLISVFASDPDMACKKAVIKARKKYDTQEIQFDWRINSIERVKSQERFSDN
jgi:hypothetical protein